MYHENDNWSMDSNQIFLVTDVTPSGESRCTVVTGARDHAGAYSACLKDSSRVPVAVVSLAEMEATIDKVKRALKGESSDLEVLRA